MLHGSMFSESKRWSGSTNGPGAAETATSFVSSGVSGTHEKYQVGCSLWGVVSAKGADSFLVPRVSLSSSISVVVPTGWSRGRCLSVRCSTSCKCAVSVARNSIQPISA